MAERGETSPREDLWFTTAIDTKVCLSGDARGPQWDTLTQRDRAILKALLEMALTRLTATPNRSPSILGGGPTS